MKRATVRVLGGAVLVATLWLVASCATAPSPAQMETSPASVRAAQEVGSTDAPRAASYVQLAREQAERAKGLLEDGERAEAESQFARAQADAELALALAREEVERVAAQEAIDDVRTLQARK
jgi:outer membrane murein-binding lipoprotein Lpp